MSNKFIVCFIVILVFTLVPRFAWSAGEKTPSLSPKEGKLWEDDRIGIILDKVEKTDIYPKSLVPFGRRYPSPSRRNIYLVIHFTVARVEGVHLGMAESILVDAKGNEHKMDNLQYSRVKMRGGLKGDYEINQGAAGIMVFELPVDVKPVTLKFIYTFWESWEEKVIKYGKIDINLLRY